MLSGQETNVVKLFDDSTWSRGGLRGKDAAKFCGMALSTFYLFADEHGIARKRLSSQIVVFSLLDCIRALEGCPDA